MAEWNEADHPRDDEGKFTFKNGGGLGGYNSLVLEGGIEKTDYPENYEHKGSDEVGSGRGETIAKIGKALGSVLKTVLTPETISAITTVLSKTLTEREVAQVGENLKQYMESSQKPVYKSQFERMREEIVRISRAEAEKIQRRADILYPNMPDKRETMTGGAAPVNSSGLDKKLQQKKYELGLGIGYDPFGYNYAKSKYGEDTVGMVDLAHENPKNPNYGANTIELKSYEDVENGADREYLRDKITKQFNDYGFNPRTIKGRIFPSNTEPSQRVAQNRDFLETIKNNKDKILRGEQTSGYFPNYKDAQESNWHFAIGQYDLRNGYLDKRGNLHIQMFDTYDFNKDNHTPLNQAGRNRMIKGTLKPSFSIHDIIVPNYVIDEIWR